MRFVLVGQINTYVCYTFDLIYLTGFNLGNPLYPSVKNKTKQNDKKKVGSLIRKHKFIKIVFMKLYVLAFNINKNSPICTLVNVTIANIKQNSFV